MRILFALHYLQLRLATMSRANVEQLVSGRIELLADHLAVWFKDFVEGARDEQAVITEQGADVPPEAIISVSLWCATY